MGLGRLRAAYKGHDMPLVIRALRDRHFARGDVVKTALAVAVIVILFGGIVVASAAAPPAFPA